MWVTSCEKKFLKVSFYFVFEHYYTLKYVLVTTDCIILLYINACQFFRMEKLMWLPMSLETELHPVLLHLLTMIKWEICLLSLTAEISDLLRLLFFKFNRSAETLMYLCYSLNRNWGLMTWCSNFMWKWFENLVASLVLDLNEFLISFKFQFYEKLF